MNEHSELPNSRPGVAPIVTPRRLIAAACLLVQLVALMWVSSYAKAKPSLWGFPFFYWYQLLWVFLGAALTAIAYRAVVTEERARRAATSTAGPPPPDSPPPGSPGRPAESDHPGSGDEGGAR